MDLNIGIDPVEVSSVPACNDENISGTVFYTYITKTNKCHILYQDPKSTSQLFVYKYNQIMSDNFLLHL